jgi:hypothetical protein
MRQAIRPIQQRKRRCAIARPSVKAPRRLKQRPVSTSTAIAVCRTIKGVRKTPGTGLMNEATGGLCTPPAGSGAASPPRSYPSRARARPRAHPVILVVAPLALSADITIARTAWPDRSARAGTRRLKFMCRARWFHARTRRADHRLRRLLGRDQAVSISRRLADRDAIQSKCPSIQDCLPRVRFGAPEPSGGFRPGLLPTVTSFSAGPFSAPAVVPGLLSASSASISREACSQCRFSPLGNRPSFSHIS